MRLCVNFSVMNVIVVLFILRLVSLSDYRTKQNSKENILIYSPQNGGQNCEGNIRGNYKTCNTQVTPALTRHCLRFVRQTCSKKGKRPVRFPPAKVFLDFDCGNPNCPRFV